MAYTMHRVVFHTFQRTGRNFTLNAIDQVSGIWIDSTQSNDSTSLDQYDKIITIVRDPLESIVSLASMAAKFHPGVPVEENVKASSENWINFHTDANMANSIFLDFKELEDDSESFIKKVLSIAKIDQLKDYTEVDFTTLLESYEKNHESGFTVSEKNNPLYSAGLEYATTLDLSEHYDVYHRLLEKCV